MSNVIPFRSSKAEPASLSVLIWRGTNCFKVTIFDHGHERETQTFRTYDEANSTAASWLLLGATIEDRISGQGGAA